jgi:hypothetical protein
MIMSVSYELPPLPSIELDSSTDEEDNTAREVDHLAMALRSSLTMIITDVWENAKCARVAAEEEDHGILRAKCASIRSEMVWHGYVIVDYSNDV